MIGILDSIFLGFVQGVTEFLPISSSGHLVIFQTWIGLTHGQVFFDVMLHIGTLAAVLAVYRNDLRDLLASLWEETRNWAATGGPMARLAQKPGPRFFGFVALASVPTGLIGFFFEEKFEILFASVLSVGYMLLINGLILWGAGKLKETPNDIGSMTWTAAVAVGFAQGLAITPGISRSGITIATGLLFGLRREFAVKFSFLLSIPAILGAAVLKLESPPPSLIPSDWLAIGLGMAVSFLFGYGSIRLLILMVVRGNLRYFSVYCWVLGGLILVNQWLGT
jgi:undecaprenyl-diphosphatase